MLFYLSVKQSGLGMRLYTYTNSLFSLRQLNTKLKACFISLYSFPSEISIPIEIKRLGAEAIKVYWKALREGKEKIPYCSMLILGDETVGKTSLYRQLVGKDFKENLSRTEGIDDNAVDVVDSRKLDINEWKEKESSEEAEDGGFVKALSKKLVENLPPPPPPPPEVKDDGDIKEEVSEEDLMERIMDAVKRIKQSRVREQSDSPLPQPQPSTHLPTSASKLIPTEVQKKDDIVGPQQEKKNPQPHTKPKTPPDATSQDATPPDATPSDINPSNAPPIPAEEESPAMLDRRQSSILDIAVKKRVVDSKNPPLVLNTLDFAGQKLYRPMHHCFILRRALYIVVFKIPDMLKETSCKKSLEEVRYWIHSIHSHIYPPEKDVIGEEKKMNRVFLVGTHRGDHTDEDLEKIDKFIDKKLIEDKSCCNHICPVGELSCPTSYFIPVENKIDHTHGKDYLRDSGTGVVQNLVETTSKTLPFLNEKYPIKWLKFEERLKKKMVTLSTTPVMTVEGVKALAVRSNITSEDQQDLALKFFHDTGKIICISELI